MEPLPSQLQLLSAAVEAMEKRTVALLESPTGTGKSLGVHVGTRGGDHRRLELNNGQIWTVWGSKCSLHFLFGALS